MLEGRVFNTKWPRKNQFTKGHTRSRAENMHEEANALRLLGLLQARRNDELRRKGYRIVTSRSRIKMGFKAKLRHKRARQENAVKNAREITKIALDNAAKAMRVAVEVMDDPRNKGSERLAAVEIVLNRAAGRPTQTNINASVDANAPPAEATGKELDQRIAETLERVERITGRAPKAKKRPRPALNLRKDDPNPGGSTVH